MNPEPPTEIVPPFGTPRQCSACGAVLEAGTAASMCPGCLLKAAMVSEVPPSGMGADSMAGVYSVDHDVQPGARISHYRLGERIGRGGMGEVFLAEQIEPVQRTVAFKVIRRGMDSGPIVARFQAERQALAMMDHPHIATVLDAGETPLGRPFFVMEYVEGVPITRFCEDRKLPLGARIALFLTVCSAVQHAHQKGIIHRDLKPSNILVEEKDGQPGTKVIDFGLARAVERNPAEVTLLTAAGQILGTPDYMAPEQASGSPDVDTRVDVYALGAVLYELIAGEPPFGRKRLRIAAWEEIIRIIRDEEPLRPSRRLTSLNDGTGTASSANRTGTENLAREVRGDLDWIVMKALEKDRHRRYDGVSALAADVKHYLSHEPVSARPPSAAYVISKLIRRHKTGFAAAAAVVLALILGIAGTTWGLMRAEANARAEKKANGQSQKRLGQIEKANDILTSIFAGLDPRSEESDGKTLREILSERLDAATAQLEGEAIGDPLVVATMQMRLGYTQLGLGNPEKAIVLLTKSRQSREMHLGLDHPDSLQVMNHLGWAFRDAGKLDEAVPLLEKTLELTAAKLGSGHRDTLEVMNNLGSAYQMAGRSGDAVPLLKKTSELTSDMLGPENPETLRTLNNLASALQSASQPDEAVSLLERIQAQTEAASAPGSLDSLRAMNNLGLAYLNSGKLDKARPLLEKARDLATVKLWRAHPDNLKILENLASARQFGGDPEGSLPLFKEVLELTTAKRGPDHPDTLRAMNNLGSASQAAGRLDEAVPLLEKALTLAKVQFGPDDPNTLRIVNNLATAHQAAGKLDEAIPLFRQVLEQTTARQGPDHFDTLRAMNNLGSACLAAGKAAEAVPLLEKTLALAKVKLGPDDPNTLKVMENLGSACEAAGKPEQALAVFSVLAARERDLGRLDAAGNRFGAILAAWNQRAPEAWNRFSAESGLGSVLLERKDREGAGPLLLSGYEGLAARAASIPDDEKACLFDAAGWLVRLAEAREDSAAAEKWKAERERWNPGRKPGEAK